MKPAATITGTNSGPATKDSVQMHPEGRGSRERFRGTGEDVVAFGLFRQRRAEDCTPYLQWTDERAQSNLYAGGFINGATGLHCREIIK
jgi:hypothetical protein